MRSIQAVLGLLQRQEMKKSEVRFSHNKSHDLLRLLFLSLDLEESSELEAFKETIVQNEMLKKWNIVDVS